MNSRTETDHELERVHWAREVEELDLVDGELVTVGSRSEGEVRAEDTIECSCGRWFDADEKDLIREHIRTARTEEVPVR